MDTPSEEQLMESCEMDPSILSSIENVGLVYDKASTDST